MIAPHERQQENAMTTQATAPALNINDLKRYSPEARVNMPLLRSKDLVTRMNCYEPGQVTPVHTHPDDDEIVFCVEGRGRITFEGLEDVPISPGSLVVLPAGIAHGIEAAADSRMVVIYVIASNYTSTRPKASSAHAAITLPGERIES
jgi:quercetin dioxygenase-like cupin family protein